MPMDWQTGVLVPIFQKGGQRGCLNYRGITLLGLPGRAYARERRLRPFCRTSDLRGVVWILVPVLEPWTSSFPSQDYWRGPGSLPNQSTCALWTSCGVPLGSLWGCCGSMGQTRCTSHRRKAKEFKYLGVLFTSCSSKTGATPDPLGEEEPSQKENLSIYWSVYGPTLTYGH